MGEIELVMAMFRQLVDEHVESGNIEQLELLKSQFERDIKRIGKEKNLMEKYELVCSAIKSLNSR